MPTIRKCSAINCDSRRTPENPVKLHAFPRNENLCLEWVRRANNPNLLGRPLDKVSKSAYLCEKHFTAAQYMCPIAKKLHRGAIPEIFSVPDSDPGPSVSCHPPASSHSSSTTHTSPSTSILSTVQTQPSTLPSPPLHAEDSIPAVSPHSVTLTSPEPMAHSSATFTITCGPPASVSDINLSTPTSTTSFQNFKDGIMSNADNLTPPSRISHDGEGSSSTYSCTPKKVKSGTLFPRGYSCQRLVGSTPRKKYLYERLRECSKKVSYLKQKQQEAQKKLSSLLKGESDVSKLLFAQAPKESSTIISSLLRNSNVPRDARRWSTQEKLIFLSFYKRSPRAYVYISTILNVPAVSTLKSLLLCIPFYPGINHFIMKYLQKQVSRMEEKDKLCVLLFDEMAIMPSLTYNTRLDMVEGFQDHGGNGRSNAIASEALVFMIRGISKQWKQPVAYYFSAGSTPGPHMAVLIKEVLSALTNAGLKVAAIVCDMGSNNTSALKILGSTKTHPYISFNGEDDPPHLMKCTRNMFIKYCIEGKVDIAGAQVSGIGKWQHIEEAITISRGCSGNVIAFPKITPACLQPRWKEKMSVSMAANIFSQALASQMDVFVGLGLMDPGAAVTAEFLIFIKKLFQSFNSFNQGQDVDDLLSPLCDTSPHIAFWNEALKKLKILTFLLLKKTSTGEILLHPSGKPKIIKAIRSRSQDGWMSTIRAVKLLWCRLKKEEFKKLETRRLNQDPLENLFGSIRFHSGCNSNPNSLQFASSIKTSMLHGTPKVGTKGGNCQVDDDTFLSDLEELMQQIPDEVPQDEEFNIENLETTDTPDDVNPISGEMQRLELCNTVLKSVMKSLTCSDCINVIYTEESLFGENFGKHSAMNRDGKTFFPSALLKDVIYSVTESLTKGIPNVAHKIGLKKSLSKSLNAKERFSWVKCSAHDLSQDIYDAVIENGIRMYCRV